ncbi:MAG: hypothetical protein WD423_07275 [Rhodothermales bacterium]
MTKEINLEVREHEAFKAIGEKRRRAKKDIARLNEIAAEADREAEEMRSALGRIELAKEMGQEADEAEDVSGRLQRAEVKASEARAEAKRRQAVIDDLQDELVAVIRTVSDEINEVAHEQIRTLSQRAVELQRQLHEVQEEVSGVEDSIQQSARRIYNRYQTHSVRLPHDSVVLEFKTNPMHNGYTNGMRKHFERVRALGYETERIK